MLVNGKEVEFDRTKCDKYLLLLKDIALVSCGNPKLYPIIKEYFEKVQMRIFDLESAELEKRQMESAFDIIKHKCIDDIEPDETYEEYVERCEESGLPPKAICDEDEYKQVKRFIERTY